MIGKIRAGAAGGWAENRSSPARRGMQRKLLVDRIALGTGSIRRCNRLDLRRPSNAPVFVWLKALIYYSNVADIRATLVGGRPVVQGGRVLGSDMDFVRAHTNDCCRRLWRGAAENKVFPEGVVYPDPGFVCC